MDQIASVLSESLRILADLCVSIAPGLSDTLRNADQVARLFQANLCRFKADH